MTTTEQTQPDQLGTLRDRVTFVTGGTRGIGAAICRALAGAGAAVAAGYWHQHERAEKFHDEMRAAYPRSEFTVHEGNIGHADDCRRVLGEVIDQHGRLDSGRIINVSSVIGETGNIGQVNYAASKSGLFGLTKSLARESLFQLGRAGHPVSDGIGLTVNAVTPGYIATDMLGTIPDKVLDRIRGQIPVGRLGRPEEIARVVCFLAADESAYITGQIWAVNGGLDM